MIGSKKMRFSSGHYGGFYNCSLEADSRYIVKISSEDYSEEDIEKFWNSVYEFWDKIWGRIEENVLSLYEGQLKKPEMELGSLKIRAEEGFEDVIPAIAAAIEGIARDVFFATGEPFTMMTGDVSGKDKNDPGTITEYPGNGGEPEIIKVATGKDDGACGVINLFSAFLKGSKEKRKGS